MGLFSGAFDAQELRYKVNNKNTVKIKLKQTLWKMPLEEQRR